MAVAMKKTRKTRLVIERDILRILQSHELRRIEAGIRITEFCTTKQQVTTDSVQICCA